MVAMLTLWSVYFSVNKQHSFVILCKTSQRNSLLSDSEINLYPLNNEDVKLIMLHTQQTAVMVCLTLITIN